MIFITRVMLKDKTKQNKHIPEEELKTSYKTEARTLFMFIVRRFEFKSLLDRFNEVVEQKVSNGK